MVEHVALVTFEGIPNQVGFLSAIFNSVAGRNINVDMISKTATTGPRMTLSFTVSEEDIPALLEITNQVRTKYPDIRPMVSGGNTKIVLFGEDLPTECGVAAKAFTALNEAGIDVIMIVTSDQDISLLLRGADADTAYEVLHKAYSD